MYGIFGIYHKSCYEVCQALDYLNFSYEIYGKKFNEYKRVSNEKSLINIIVVDSVNRASKVRADDAMMIVCDSQPALAKTNANKTLYPGEKLRLALTKAVSFCIAKQKNNSKQITFTIKQTSLNDILKVATTYSFLNGIQTALYKITPYKLRKQTQTNVISYFYGDLNYTNLEAYLNSSSKLATISDLCKDPKARELRQACIAARKNPKFVEKIAKSNGFASFELMYVIKSHEKTLTKKETNQNDD